MFRGFGGGGPPYLGGYDHRGGYDNQRANRARFRAQQEARNYGYELDYDGLGDVFEGLDLGGYGGGYGGGGGRGYGGFGPPAPRRHGFGGFVRPRRHGGGFFGGRWAGFGRSARLPIAQVPRGGFGYYGGREYAMDDDFGDGYSSESDNDDDDYDDYEDRRAGFGRAGFRARDPLGRRRPRW